MNIPEFSLSAIFSFLFGKTGQMCIGFLWDLQRIDMIAKSVIKMRDCSKVLVNSICDDSLPFKSTSSMWLDNCVDSVAPEAKLLNWNLSPAISEQKLIGGKAIDGPGCF